jgi:hypothetical protein
VSKERGAAKMKKKKRIEKKSCTFAIELRQASHSHLINDEGRLVCDSYTQSIHTPQ